MKKEEDQHSRLIQEPLSLSLSLSLAKEKMNSGLSFFKVISNSQKMDLPLATVPQLQGVLGRRVTLRNVDKESWSVGVERGGDGFSFTEGWPKFYQENSLEPDYVVLFTYKHKDLFDVKVFGHNACEKRGVGRTDIRVEEEAEELEEYEDEEGEEGDEEEDKDEDEDEDEDDDDEDYVIEELEPEEEETVSISKNKSKSHRFNSNHAFDVAPIGRFEEHGIDIDYEEDEEEEARTVAKAKHKSRSSSSSPIEVVKEEVIEIEDDEDEDEDDKESMERDEHDEIAEANNKSKAKHKHSRPSSSSSHKKRNLRDYYGHDIFLSGLATQPKNPYFVSRSRHSRNNELSIPKDVMLCLNLKIPSTLFLVDKNGRKWEAEIKKWKDGRLWCTSGWKRMCRANNIGEDDTCICEFVQEGRFGLSMLVRVVDAAAVSI